MGIAPGMNRSVVGDKKTATQIDFDLVTIRIEELLLKTLVDGHVKERRSCCCVTPSLQLQARISSVHCCFVELGNSGKQLRFSGPLTMGIPEIIDNRARY